MSNFNDDKVQVVIKFYFLFYLVQVCLNLKFINLQIGEVF